VALVFSQTCRLQFPYSNFDNDAGILIFFAVAFLTFTVRKPSHGLRLDPNRLLLNPLQLSIRKSRYSRRYTSEMLNASKMHQNETLMK
jgi:hypothetical protein